MTRHALARAGIRAAATTVLAALVAGIPAMLIYGVGAPLPSTGLPWTDQLAALLTQPPTGRLLLGITAPLLWALWAVFVLSLAAELADSIRYGLRRTRQRTNPMRALALLLLTAAATGTLATGATAIHAPAGGTLHDDLSRLTTAAEENPPAGQPAPADVTEPVITPGPATPRSGLWDGTTTRPPAVSEHSGPVVLQVAQQRYTVEVVKGDTLWDLADAWLGDPFRWPEIYELNRDRYDRGGGMQGGDHIEPTWVLVLPDDAAPPEGAQPAPDRVPDEPAGTDRADRPVNSVPEAPVQQSRPFPDGELATIAPAPSTPAPGPSSTPRVDQSDAAAEAVNEDDEDQVGDHDGVTLPGGWVSVGLAAALAAAAATVWRRRRHRWIPPAVGMPDPEPAAPLPPAVARLRRGVRTQAPDLLDPPLAPEATVREALAADQPPPAPQAGPSGAELAGLGQLAASGTALTGPGAPAAARALLVATLSTGGPDDPDARAEVIIPASILAELLGGSATVDLVGNIPRLRVTAGLGHALSQLEERILTRTRELADRDLPDLASLHDADPLHEPMPPVLLLADVPDQAWSPRLSTALQVGRPVEAGAVLLGAWPPGHTIHVEADGTTGDPDQRLSVLDPATTVDLLAVLREAHTGTTSAPPRDHPAPQPAAEQPPETGDSAATEPAAPSEVALKTPAVANQPAGAETRTLRVRIEILGHAAIYDASGEPVTGLRGGAIALLVYLAVHRNGADIPDILEAIWPNATLRRARERLSTDVANLRTRIRAAAGIAPDQASDLKPVINTGGRYHLNPDCLDIDWWRVLDAARRSIASSDPVERRAALEEALGDWGGELYDNKYEWIEPYQQTCRKYGITIHTQLAGLLADTDPQHAAALLEAVCDIDPLNEEAARRAMRAHAQLGDPSAIRRRLDLLTEALETIDEETSEETLLLASDLAAR